MGAFDDDDWGDIEEVEDRRYGKGIQSGQGPSTVRPHGVTARTGWESPHKADPFADDDWGDLTDETTRESRIHGKGRIQHGQHGVVGPGGGKIEAWVPSTRPGSRAWELTDFDDIQDPILKAEEILKGRMAFEPVQERHLKALFSVFDRDGNNFISKDEFKALYATFDTMGCEKDDVMALLRQHNMLGDDRLSYEEFSLLVCRMLSR
jgi:hypothetical protein|uniref:EF-hand domain-containing protein n=1 Tax=Eutreptiella gymnastica TaxID=73025 RepID=A0A7S4GKN4_9EUGL|eukprot:CAMPEP_0174295118 /NCGR_PEP_ID=MMETSP0809-20121228/43701_1 /TAXON_ID=73025 ORGANISM="Eutreptiella gymnastica-like, Strain CCMP1594" /NCGR_SAMPLE_ID=MMETSP0809 /ASSEMBLY_ACC=CAM_ASM_000658 /LENGTH=206 /DNA_ID=CAMNT_0015397113 /DNA_START=21 /DNA_END=641 /DNA_ORIENTATION=+